MIIKIKTEGGKHRLSLPMTEKVKRLLARCVEKHGGYVSVELAPPKKPRTTGDGSQNHHLNGHIMQICNETGCDYDGVKNEVKRIAMEVLGYPFRMLGASPIPQRERDCSTDECAKLIEAVHYLAGDLGIILKETE